MKLTRLFILVTAVVVLLTVPQTDAFAQGKIRPLDNNMNIGTRQSDFFINVATYGIGVGYRRHFQYKNDISKLSFGIEVSGIRDDDSYTFYDPYTGNQVKLRGEFFTFVVPITMGYKIRLWKDSIEDSMRPYLAFEAGPVVGFAFPTEYGFKESFNRFDTKIAPKISVAFGVEFGDETKRTYGFSIGFHFMEFFEELGKKKAYNGIDLRLNILKSW